MSEYVVEPKSRYELRELASEFRKMLGLSDCLYFPVVEILDVMCDVFKGFSYEIVPDSELPPDIHAETDVTKQQIRIKESVYDGAAEGNGRDRMTIAHEIGHFITLCICGFSLKRRFGKRSIPAYQSPEWHAKCFGGELLVSADLTKGMSPFEIEVKCGVSEHAALYQYSIMNRRRYN